MSIGDHEIRKQSSGKELPGPRELQLALFLSKSFDLPDRKSYHVNQIGQWITHDISLMGADVSGKNTIKFFLSTRWLI